MGDSLNTPKLSADLPRIGNALSQQLGTIVLRMLGWKFVGEFPAYKKMIVAVAPHTSNWDFVVGIAVAFSLRLKISFFAKGSLFIPPFDLLLRRCGGIPIERSKSQGVVDQMVQKIRTAEQIILCLAPEGTRSKQKNWKTGFLHIAHKADIPVFLVAFDYKKKQIELGPARKISDDIQTELNQIYRYYASVQGKYPANVATNIIVPKYGDND
jgi:1-acyl-sn-glycerol-3-phosphate acyltransferase